MELQEKKKNRTEQKTDMQNKEKALLTQLDEIAKQDLCLAFSGGVDSSLLLKLVMDASAKYGTKVYAVTFQTRLHPPCDLETATRVARRLALFMRSFLLMSWSRRQSVTIRKTAAISVSTIYLGNFWNLPAITVSPRYSTEQMRMTFMSTGRGEKR